MKRILQFIILLTFSSVYADVSAGVFLLTDDSLHRYPHYINKHWKFIEGDDPSMASITYDDSHWIETRPILEYSDTSKIKFSGIGWFRLHFIADSSVTGKPIALTMSHYGASEIYIDGKLLQKYGVINGPDSSAYYDPRELPIIFIVNDTGAHVLAVRYANFDAAQNFERYMQTRAGFRMMFGNADEFIHIKNQRSTVISFMCMLLGGIFLAICVIHLFLYFYHRADRSNLFFSIFMFCIACLFIIGFISYASTTPSFAIKTIFLINIVIILACISLSGLIRELFSKNKSGFS